MFWSPSRKVPACTLQLELADSDEDAEDQHGQVHRVQLEHLASREELESTLERELSELLSNTKSRRIVGVKLESSVSNCSLPEALRRGHLWGSPTLAKYSYGLRDIRSVASNDDVDSLFAERRVHSFVGLRRLNLSGSNLSSLSGTEIKSLTALEHLDLSDNTLAILPKELGTMPNLKTLNCQRNSLTILPGELGHCRTLETLDLKSNRLSSILISFANLKNLVRLDLDDNPLSAFPDLSPCTKLRSLAFGSVRIEATSDQSDSVTVVTSFDRQQSSKALVINFWGAPKDVDPVQEFYDLALRGSTHHPLIVRGLATMIESAAMKKAFLKNSQALEKVALMLLSECGEVVTNACRVLGLLSAYDKQTADRILNSHGDILLSLCRETDTVGDTVDETGTAGAPRARRQVAGLRTMETITRFASATDHHRLEEKLVAWAISMVNEDWDGVHAQVKVTLLRTLGNLCCGSRGDAGDVGEGVKPSWRELPEFHAFVEKVGGLMTSNKDLEPVDLSVRRLTSILGMHALPRHPGGIRVLSLDGGGMKGLSTIRMLREIERITNKPLRESFDLVVGTSTGALLTVALMIKGFSLDECEAVYKEVGHKVFKHPIHSGENGGGVGSGSGGLEGTNESKTSKASRDNHADSNNASSASWASVFYRSLTSKTDSVRAVVVGCKHDTSTYEEILKDRCSMASIGSPDSGSYDIESMIDTSALDVPKIALVSALTSISPVVPFIFRNYEYGRDTPADRTRVGSCSHAVWEAVRASSAATYYLDGFKCGGRTFVDGALIANNPSLVALQEAHRIWPNERIGFLLSVGVGSTPTTERQEGISSYLDTGSAYVMTTIARKTRNPLHVFTD